MTLEELAVVADLPDNPLRPVGSKPQALAEVHVKPEEAAHGGVGRTPRQIDTGGGYAELLGGNQRIEGPAHDAEPLVVSLPYGRSDRSLGDQLRQNDVLADIALSESGAC